MMVDAALTPVWVQDLRNNSGSLAMLAAIRRASSRVSSLPVARRPGSSSQYTKAKRLPVVVAHGEARRGLFDSPGRREAAGALVAWAIIAGLVWSPDRIC
jgi:hypothetical protein